MKEIDLKKLKKKTEQYEKLLKLIEKEDYHNYIQLQKHNKHNLIDLILINAGVAIINILISRISIPFFLFFFSISSIFCFFFNYYKIQEKKLLDDVLSANDFILELMEENFLNRYENNNKHNTFFYALFPFNKLLKAYQNNQLTPELAKSLIVSPFDYDELLQDIKDIDEKTKLGLNHFVKTNNTIYKIANAEFYIFKNVFELQTSFVKNKTNYDNIITEYKNAIFLLNQNNSKLNENEIQMFNHKLNKKLIEDPQEVVSIRKELNQLILNKL